jgi:hypothetical protein
VKKYSEVKIGMEYFIKFGKFAGSTLQKKFKFFWIDKKIGKSTITTGG